MRKVLTIAAMALKRFGRERSNLFFVFILPIGIIILVGSQFGAGALPTIGVYEPADGGRFATMIVESLEQSDEVQVRRYDSRDTLEDAVALGNLQVGIAIPDMMTARVEAGEDLTVELLAPAGVQIGAYEALVGEAVTTAVQREAAVRFLVGRGAVQADAAAAIDNLADDVPAITVASTETGESLFEGITGQFEIGSTSQLVLFMFLTGLTGSAALIQSKNYGVTRRMLSTPTSASTVISGEALGRLAVVLVQGIYIIIATTLMFQIDWGNLLGVVAILIAFGACGAGAAMLFGTLFRNDQQASGVGVMVGLGIAALGGCMVPIELFPSAMETVAQFTPHAWAMDAFAELQRRDGTIVDILPQLAVILGFAAVLIAVASWRMSVTLGRSDVSA